MENPSHLISTLQRVFWAGTVQGWAASPAAPEQVWSWLSSGPRLKSSTLERDG